MLFRSRQIDPKFKAAVTLAPSLFVPGGLGKVSLDHLRNFNLNYQWGVGLIVDRESFALLGDTRRPSLDREMETMTAFLADPGFRDSANVRIPDLVDSLEQGLTDPTSKALLELSDMLGQGNWLGYPTKKELRATRMADIKAAPADPLSNEQLEVTIVGDLPEAEEIGRAHV